MLVTGHLLYWCLVCKRFWRRRKEKSSYSMVRKSCTQRKCTSNVCSRKLLQQWYFRFKTIIYPSDISSWITSSVKNMAYMFRGTLNFNVDLSRWDSSAVTTMAHSRWKIKVVFITLSLLQIFYIF